MLWGLTAPGDTITANWKGTQLRSAHLADSTGRFEITIPAGNASADPATLELVSAPSGATLALTDVVIGDVFVCSGQSNMELNVGATAEKDAVLAASAALGPVLRLFQVAMRPEYPSVTTPQSNLTASISWSRASPSSAVGMSAFCYNFGAHAVAAHPGVPIGLQANAWGGVAIQVYMSPAALAECPGAAAVPSLADRLAAAVAPGASRAEVALGVVAAAELAAADPRGQLAGGPTAPGCLYNSMLYPLLSNSVTGVLWYQVGAVVPTCSRDSAHQTHFTRLGSLS